MREIRHWAPQGQDWFSFFPTSSTHSGKGIVPITMSESNTESIDEYNPILYMCKLNSSTYPDWNG